MKKMMSNMTAIQTKGQQQRHTKNKLMPLLLLLPVVATFTLAKNDTKRIIDGTKLKPQNQHDTQFFPKTRLIRRFLFLHQVLENTTAIKDTVVLKAQRLFPRCREPYSEVVPGLTGQVLGSKSTERRTQK